MKGVDKEEIIVGWRSKNSHLGPIPEIRYSVAQMPSSWEIPQPSLPEAHFLSLAFYHGLVWPQVPQVHSYQSAPFWPGCLLGVAPCMGPLP